MAWEYPAMTEPDAVRLRRPLLAALYIDAMVLADDTRAYIEHVPDDDRDMPDPVTRVLLACEQLRMTTRLMTVLAWLLAWRAVDAGEMDGASPPQLDPVSSSDMAAVDGFPDSARTLIEAGIALYRRAAFLDASIAAAPLASPALAMQRRLAAAL
jgi:regulator of CtrA degradation